MNIITWQASNYEGLFFFSFFKSSGFNLCVSYTSRVNSYLCQWDKQKHNQGQSGLNLVWNETSKIPAGKNHPGLQHLRPKCVTMYMHRACVQHHHLIRSSSCNSTAIWSCFNYNLRSGVMSLAENLLWASWSFDCRVKIKNMIPVTCRNLSINRKIPCCFIYLYIYFYF